MEDVEGSRDGSVDVNDLAAQIEALQREILAARAAFQQQQAALAQLQAENATHQQETITTRQLFATTLAAAQAQQARPPPAPAAVASALKPKQPDTFTGSDRRTDVETWLFQVEKYVTVTKPGAGDAEKVDFACLYLKDAALTWWRALSSAGQLPTTWQSFRDLMHKQFLPVNNVKLARDRLAQLKQLTSVREYAFRLRLTLLEIPGIAEEEKLDRFVRGLKPHVRKDVELRDPKTLEEAVSQAEIIDMNSYRMQGPKQFTNFQSAPKRSYASVVSGPTPMELGAMDGRPRRPLVPRLPPAQRNRPQSVPIVSRSEAQLRQLCFYCHQPGHRIADCPQRPKGNAARPVLQRSGR